MTKRLIETHKKDLSAKRANSRTQNQIGMGLNTLFKNLDYYTEVMEIAIDTCTSASNFFRIYKLQHVEV